MFGACRRDPEATKLREDGLSESIDRVCQRIMEERGYLVIGSYNNIRIGVPHENSFAGHNHESLSAKVVPMSKTSVEDYRAQAKYFKGRARRAFSLDPQDGANFYRVIAE